MLDHGTLNTPLRSRGNIDRDIDRLKANALKAAKEKAKQRRALVIEAKALVAALTDEQVKVMSDKAGMTVAQGRKWLASMSRFQPACIVKVLGKKG